MYFLKALFSIMVYVKATRQMTENQGQRNCTYFSHAYMLPGQL